MRIAIACLFAAAIALLAAAGGDSTRSEARALPVVSAADDGAAGPSSATPPTSATTDTGPTPPLAGKTILVDPGHNGANARHPETINRLVPAGGFKKACDTTGTATDDGRFSETAFNWDVAKRLRRLLRKDGAKVVMTRHNDHGVGPCINRRAAIGNRAKADVAISIHADGGPPGGFGFHAIRPGPEHARNAAVVRGSLALATDLRGALVAAGLKTSSYAGSDGIHRRSDMGGLNLSTVPKVIVELGNMRNAGDARRLKRGSWREQTASALASGLSVFLVPPAE